ncbi:unnamed protein product [Adineta steineri]|uniref:Uncharacterized protein n=1 Tax=Adineta steineri TaxID=433720 RepID=A0A814NXZ9_9BILA|nr:unnamed protein product [Adineta steineri]CAF1089731.1 unnamed protein product [Adineta steineri]CAF1099649.1 unnamed protein product [Adineta steineri]
MHFVTSNVTSVFFIIFLLISPLKLITATTSENDKNNSSFLQKVCSRLNLNEDQCCILGKSSTFLGYAAIAGAVGTMGIPALLGTMGFTATGIAGGSWAAWYQATWGVGTAFSWLQSVSMTGAAAASVTKIGLLAGGIKSYFFSGDCKKNSAEDNQCSKK